MRKWQIAAAVSSAGVVAMAGVGVVASRAGAVSSAPPPASVIVTNTPLPVSGTVSVGNFPTPKPTETVTGTVNVGNFPSPQPTQTVAGTVNVGNFPTPNATQSVAGSVSVTNFPSDQAVHGSVTTVPGAPTSPLFIDMDNVVGTGITDDQAQSADIIAITNITLSNFNTTTANVWVYHGAGELSGGSSCTDVLAHGNMGGAEPQVSFLVPANSTLQITYPTPLVFARNGSDFNCVSAEMLGTPTSGVSAYINGYTE